MDISMFIYFLSLVISVVMVLMILKISKRNKKAKRLIDTVNTFNDKDIFFNNIDNYINTVNSDEFVTKGNIVKLWGLIYYDEFDKVLEQAKTINFKTIIKKSKNGYSIELNEDSMYYYLLACSNTLYCNDKLELINQLDDLFSIKKEVNDTLVYAIYNANKNYYFKEEDFGEMFYKSVLNGEYGQYDYSKGLIGLYKSIIEVMLSRIYIDRKDFESFNGLKDSLRTFNKTTIGSRYIQELKLGEYILEEEE